MNGDQSGDQQATIEAILDAAKRPSRKTNVRNCFVQKGTQSEPRPGLLREMVRRHDERCLDLFLLHRTLASSEPWDARPMPAGAWARALGVHTDRDGGKAAVSKAWHRMKNTYALVESNRSGRRNAYTSLHENGTGDEYFSPDGKTPENYYLTVPFEYWTAPEQWYRKLSLPAKAMLLIGASLEPGFLLPTEKAPAWYGISRDTAARGLRELEANKLLIRKKKMKRTPLEDSILTTEHRFTLIEPFGRPPTSTPIVAAALTPTTTSAPAHDEAPAT